MSAIHCPNCGSLACESMSADDYRTMEEQIAAYRDRIKSALSCLQSSHVQENKHRLGALGSQDIDSAIASLSV